MPTPPRPCAEVLEELLASRRSCRAFLPREVPQPLVERILRAAQRTASWCNVQPWQLIVTRDAATEQVRLLLQRAARASGPQANEGADIAFPAQYRGVHLDRRRASGFQLYTAVGVARGDRAAGREQALRNFDLFDAPHLVLVTTPRELGTYGAVDCGAWVSTFMLVAWAHGIASIAQASLARQSALLRHHLGLGDDVQVVCGVSFGYADEGHPANAYRTSRASLDEVARFIGDVEAHG